jgi:hypothetical protein
MPTSTLLAAARRYGRSVLATARSVSPSAAVAVTLTLVLGGAGAADAANGGSFLLGKANKETAAASLSNSRGTALKLSAPKGRAPLAVNRQALVKNLNAQYTGGLTAGQLQATGGEGFTQPATNTPIDVTGEIVTGTGHLPAGVYYVTATALLNVASGDEGGFCAIVKGSNPGSILAYGGQDGDGYLQAAETVALAITAGDTIKEKCGTKGTNGSVAYNAGITAIRILSSRNGAPARGRRPGSTTPPGPRPMPARPRH